MTIFILFVILEVMKKDTTTLQKIEQEMLCRKRLITLNVFFLIFSSSNPKFLCANKWLLLGFKILFYFLFCSYSLDNMIMIYNTSSYQLLSSFSLPQKVT